MDIARRTTMRRVRKGKTRSREIGYVVTWDVNSVDRPSANKLHFFVYGRSIERDGHSYRYPGFVEKGGVRYLGQSVLFVRPEFLTELERFLAGLGVDHETTPAVLG